MSPDRLRSLFLPRTATAAVQALRARSRRLFFEKEVMRLMGLTLLIKPLGLLAQMLTAAYFGAGVQYDAYAFAFFLGTFLESSLGRVHTGVLVPATIRMRRQLAPRELMGYQNAALLLFLGPGVAVTIMLALRPSWIVDLIGPNLPPETREHVVRMLPWMAVAGLVLLVATMGKAILNLNRRFGLAGLMPVLQAAVTLAALLLLQERWGIWSLVVGFVAGNLAQVVLMALGASRFKLVAAVRPRLPAGSLRQLWTLGWGFLAAQVLLTIQMSVDKIFATGLPAGSISSLSYSMTIVNMGVQLFNLSLVVVMFTRLSEFIAAGQNERGGIYFRANLERVCRIVVPVSLGLSVASGEVVRVLFMRGAFDAADASRTAGVLALHILGLPALIFNPMLGRIFHSLQRMRDKVWLTGQFLLTQIGLNLLLVGPLGVRGLAFSGTFSINLHVALALLVLHRLRLGMDIGGFAAVIARAYALGGLAFLVYRVSGVATWLDQLPFGAGKLGLSLTGLTRMAFIIIVYLLLLYAAARRGRRPPTAVSSPAGVAGGSEKE